MEMGEIGCGEDLLAVDESAIAYIDMASCFENEYFYDYVSFAPTA